MIYASSICSFLYIRGTLPIDRDGLPYMRFVIVFKIIKKRGHEGIYEEWRFSSTHS